VKKPSPLIIFVAVLASLLEIIDTSIVNVALPSMMGNLGATLEDISMVITGYAIANAVVLPLSAWLGERIGRRKYYLGCIAIFTLTSVACGFAPNLEFLILFRILQGLAGGALLPTSQTLIYEQFPKEQAGIAGAIFGMSVMIGPTLGPTMGGFLTDHFGWRSIFNVNLPLGIIALVAGMAAIHNREDEHPETNSAKMGLDAWGLALLVAGIGCLQYTLERGDTGGWFDSKTIMTTATIAAITLPLFVWWELRVKNPIINIRLFKESIVINGVLLQGLLGFFLYGVVFVLPVFVATTFHYDATQTGMLFIPGSLLTAALMPFIGKRMQAGTNPKWLIFVGLVGIEVTLYLMTKFSPLSSKGEIYRMLFMRGFAMAFIFVPLNSSILSQFRGQALGQVSGLLNLFRQIGGSVGIALVATLLASKSHQNYLDLSSKVSMLNPGTRLAYGQLTGGLSHQMSEGVGLATASQAALKAMYFKIQAQVFMMSFLQLVWIMAFIFGISFIPLYLLKLRVKPTVVSDAH
jgi:DHA2 family multidrug resistance protein